MISLVWKVKRQQILFKIVFDYNEQYLQFINIALF